MVKASRSGSQKSGSQDTQAKDNPQTQPSSLPSTNTSAQGNAQAKPSSPPSAGGQKKGKQSSSKSNKPKIGGTAIAGAKSTQQKELSTGSPANQQPEYYNRDTRRRMEHMGTGPYAERAATDPRERRKKRKERLQERQDRIKQLVNARGPSRDVRLGRRNTYFLIGIVFALILLCVAFIIIRHPF